MDRRQKLLNNKLYQTMNILTRYMDRYYIDAIIGVVPIWGDVFALFSVLPFLYFSAYILRSIPLTLAILNNALRDVLLGMIPFFVGDIIDIFHRANIRNMNMVQGFVDGDKTIIRKVNHRALQAVLILILLLVLIVLMIRMLIRFGSYLWNMVLG